MSGIYISGVECPERCGICPCFNAESPMYCQATKADKEKRMIAPYGRPRPSWCPLVHVPDHGRLIDADAMKKSVTQQIDFLRLFGGEFEEIADLLGKGIMQEIDNAPTIIPADEEAADNG